MRSFERLPRHFANLGRHSVAYTLVGQGPALLLLHGLGGNADFWQPLLGRLAGRFTLICPDLLGFGRSSKFAARYSASLHLAAIVAALRAAGDPPLHALVGHSAGGVLATLLLASGLASAGRLALVAAAYPAPRYHLRSEMVRTPLTRLLTGSRAIALVDHYLWRALWPMFGGIPAPLYLQGARVGVMEHSPASYYSSAEELLFQGDLDPFVPRLAATPTLLLYGERDATVLPVHADYYRAALPRAVLRRHAGGHYGVLNEGAPALVAWLNQPLAQLERAAEAAA